MKKLLLTLIIGIALLATLNLASAALCQTTQGYYDDCDKPMIRYRTSYASDDGDRATVPIFKGSYGNYRYKKYVSGDRNPSQYFINHGTTYPNTFGGGYGGYGGYGYGSYRGYGFGGYNYGYYGSPGYVNRVSYRGYSSFGYGPFSFFSFWN
tara:strand:- start:76 stop:531 length:456 start_codon:yes stop_codon:yes gene_type:complete